MVRDAEVDNGEAVTVQDTMPETIRMYRNNLNITKYVLAPGKEIKVILDMASVHIS
jgi:hypothetical protein